MHQPWTRNKERELHSERGACGQEAKVLIGSSQNGGDGHAADVRAHPSKCVLGASHLRLLTRTHRSATSSSMVTSKTRTSSDPSRSLSLDGPYVLRCFATRHTTALSIFNLPLNVSPVSDRLSARPNPDVFLFVFGDVSLCCDRTVTRAERVLSPLFLFESTVPPPSLLLQHTYLLHIV
jgi:hypothetical protein